MKSQAFNDFQFQAKFRRATHTYERRVFSEPNGIKQKALILIQIELLTFVLDKKRKRYIHPEIMQINIKGMMWFAAYTEIIVNRFASVFSGYSLWKVTKKMNRPTIREFPLKTVAGNWAKTNEDERQSFRTTPGRSVQVNRSANAIWTSRMLNHHQSEQHANILKRSSKYR